MKRPKQLKQQRLSFEYEAVPDDGGVTAYGGLPLVIDAMRSLGASAAIAEHVRVSERSRRHDEASVVEALVLLMAAGGDCLDDLTMLSTDKALCRLLERTLPSPETARRFLYACHDERLVEAAKAEALARGESSYVPEENAPLAGLQKAQQALVRGVAARGRCKVATVDVDGTIQESRKREAKEHYQGGRGYQPVVAYWCEQDLVLCDEFRDGNVPGGKDPLALVQRAFAVLPESVTERRLRADSALYNTPTLKWLVAEQIGFTVSADMTGELRKVCASMAEESWMPLEPRADERVDLCEVSFTPGHWPKDAVPLRYLALRFTPTQGELFERGAGPKYLAVVTNRAGSIKELVHWHWEKAGTIEHLHDVVKNELGGGVLPCGRFGANAAWFRLALMTYNVLSALKSIALPPELHDARPKRLRFQVLVIPAVLVSHARRLWARVSDRAECATRLLFARGILWPALCPS